MGGTPTHREPTWLCPFCGYACDAASPVGDGGAEPPKDGDCTMCLSCGGMLLRDKGIWRPFRNGEFRALPQAAQRTLFRMRRIREGMELPDLAEKQGGRA
jgi:hypothetical protein